MGRRGLDTDGIDRKRRLKILKNSARNCKTYLPSLPILKLRAKLAFSAGWRCQRKLLRNGAAVPHVPPGASLQALGFRICVVWGLKHPQLGSWVNRGCPVRFWKLFP